MAEIRQEKQGDKAMLVVRWDSSDWLKGLLPNSVDVPIAQTYGDGLAFAGAVDGQRVPGILFPAERAIAYTSSDTVDATPNASVVFNSKQYILAGSKIHETNASTVTSSGGTFPKTIAGTTPIGSDFILYNIGSTPYAFYSYNNSTIGDIGRYDLNTTFNDTYWSSTLSGSTLDKDYPHPMIVGKANILYIADGDRIAFIDARTGSAVDGVANLQLPKGYIITGLCHHPNFIGITAHRLNSSSSGVLSGYRNDAFMFFWDESSSEPTYSVKLAGQTAGGAFTYKGFPGCFTADTDRAYCVLVDTSGYTTLATIDETSLPTIQGVDVLDDDIYAVLNTTVYRIGSPFPNFQSAVFPIGSATASSMFKANLLSQFVSYISPNLVYYSGNYCNSSIINSGIKQLPPIYKGGYKVRDVKVSVVDKDGAVGIATLGFTGDNEDVSLVTVINTTNQTFSKINNYYSKDYLGAELPIIRNNIQLQIAWTSSGTGDSTAVGIEAVEILLEPIYDYN